MLIAFLLICPQQRHTFSERAERDERELANSLDEIDEME
jgi:hypothetical protein